MCKAEKIKQLINNPKIKEFIRFIIVGTIATCLHYGIFWLLLFYADTILWSNIAYSIGYVLSFIVNFYLTSYFTFKTGSSWKKLGGMIGAHGINYLLHLAFLNLFLYVGVPEKIVPIPIFCIVIPINFILVRFVFKHKQS